MSASISVWQTPSAGKAPKSGSQIKPEDGWVARQRLKLAHSLVQIPTLVSHDAQKPTHSSSDGGAPQAATCASQDCAQAVEREVALQRGLDAFTVSVVVGLFGGERRQVSVCPTLKLIPNVYASFPTWNWLGRWPVVSAANWLFAP